MKFKVGDKVKIREDLELKTYNCVAFVQDMREYRGKEAKVTTVYGCFYSLDIDNHRFAWSGEMLEPVLKLKKGEKVNELCPVQFQELSKSYFLSIGDFEITAKFSDAGITLKTKDNHDSFEFDNSSPETVGNMGRLIMEAAKFYKKKEGENEK